MCKGGAEINDNAQKPSVKASTRRRGKKRIAAKREKKRLDARKTRKPLEVKKHAGKFEKIITVNERSTSK